MKKIKIMNDTLKKDDKKNELLSFYNNKTVLVTGHTGFKGTWLIRILLTSGARVIGYSQKPPTDPNLYSLAVKRHALIGTNSKLISANLSP